jgi:hypothetical protein
VLTEWPWHAHVFETRIVHNTVETGIQRELYYQTSKDTCSIA